MNQVRIETLSDSDRSAFEAFLRPRVERSMFLLSNVHIGGLENKGQRFQGDYVAAFEGDDNNDADGHDGIVGVLSHFWNGMLNMNAPRHLGALTDAALEVSGRPVKGVIGPAEQVQATIDHLNLDLDPARVMLDEHEWLYSLQLEDLIMSQALSNGSLVGRMMEARDLKVAVPWMVAYRLEAVGEIESEKLWREVEQGMRESISRQGRWVVEDAESGDWLR